MFLELGIVSIRLSEIESVKEAFTGGYRTRIKTKSGSEYGVNETREEVMAKIEKMQPTLRKAAWN